MAFWHRFLGLSSGAGSRQEGIQLGEPAYSEAAATTVTLDSSLQLSAVWACVKLITETVASLPLNVYDVDKKGVKTLIKDHYLSLLFDGRTNRWQTKIEFFETMLYQLTSLGNAYAAIQRNSKKEIIGLIPLMSQQMNVALGKDGAIHYEYTDGANVKVYAQETVWHNKLFGNGIIGLSPLAHARNSIGIGQATEKAVTKIYKNGGKPSGALILDKVLTAAQRAQIKENFADIAEGNDDRLFVLEAGMKYQQLSLSPQDIELLKSRRFQIEDICRFWGVPSVLVNDTEAGTTWGSGIQQIVQGFYKLGLRPYLERLEASMKVNLLTPQERAHITLEFDFNSLIQPDISERMKTYKEGVGGGVMTPNEARKIEGWSPQPGGDKLYMQQQMTPMDILGTIDRGSSPAPSNPNQNNASAMSKPQSQVFNLTMPEISVRSPDINITSPTINLPATENRYEMPAPVVNITNEMGEQGDVVVNSPEMSPIFNIKVDAPTVNMEANLPAPEVQVILPKRKTETNVEYDAKGNIKRTTQLEQDA
jgi:HK97 family phage portal protein